MAWSFQEDGDLPPLVSHEPVLMDDSWIPDEKEEEERVR